MTTQTIPIEKKKNPRSKQYRKNLLLAMLGVLAVFFIGFTVFQNPLFFLFLILEAPLIMWDEIAYPKNEPSNLKPTEIVKEIFRRTTQFIYNVLIDGIVKFLYIAERTFVYMVATAIITSVAVHLFYLPGGITGWIARYLVDVAIYSKSPMDFHGLYAAFSTAVVFCMVASFSIAFAFFDGLNIEDVEELSKKESDASTPQ